MLVNWLCVNLFSGHVDPFPSLMNYGAVAHKKPIRGRVLHIEYVIHGRNR